MATGNDETKKAEKAASFELVVVNALKIPGVKVNRNEFLAKQFDGMKDVDIHQVLELGSVQAGISEEVLEKMASKLIVKRTSESSAVSFAAGIPGGLAMAATIPADTLQYFGMTLKLAQELIYLYGAEDLWNAGQIDGEMVQNQLILYCGVMFGVSGAAKGVRLLSSQLAKQTLKKLPQKALTKTIWYPIVKKICAAIGVKITKDSAAKGISKAIPVIGGIVSGGLTFLSMRPMGQRLAATLNEANFHYSEEQIMEDYEDLEGTVVDMEEHDTQSMEQTDGNEEDDIFIKIEKLAKLRDMGAISEEEYNITKDKLLAQI